MKSSVRIYDARKMKLNFLVEPHALLLTVSLMSWHCERFGIGFLFIALAQIMA